MLLVFEYQRRNSDTRFFHLFYLLHIRQLRIFVLQVPPQNESLMNDDDYDDDDDDDDDDDA